MKLPGRFIPMLYFIRHATAEEPGSGADADRRLTERGAGEARRAGQALRALRATPDLILSSTAVRAQETARLIAEALEPAPAVEVRDALYGGTSPETYLRAVEPYLATASVAVVSHQPDLSHFVRVFAGENVSFMPSSVCCLEVQGGRGRMLWMRSPAELARLCGPP
jgi:phosphohistidine phosphatase